MWLVPSVPALVSRVSRKPRICGHQLSMVSREPGRLGQVGGQDGLVEAVQRLGDGVLVVGLRAASGVVPSLPRRTNPAVHVLQPRSRHRRVHWPTNRCWPPSVTDHANDVLPTSTANTIVLTRSAGISTGRSQRLLLKPRSHAAELAIRGLKQRI